MKVLRKMVIAPVALLLFAGSAHAQCESWEGKEDKAKAMEYHVLYRGIAKGKNAEKLASIDEENFNIAYKNWEKVYEMAPAADGKRSYHFTDGIEILKALKQRTEDTEKKNEIDERIIKLYDQLAECYPDKKGMALGRKASDMFYMPSYGYRISTLEAFEDAIEKADTDLEYIIFQPLGMLVKYLFQNDKIDQNRAQNIINRATEISEFNIENNEKYGQYYDSGQKIMESELKEVEGSIFDCEYFKEKLVPRYEENKEDLDVIRYVYNKLKAQGCDPADAKLAEIQKTYESLAAERNAQMEAEFLANNPGVAARRLYDEGKFDEAIAKYEEAIANATEDDKKADYYFGIASIQFRKQKKYGAARTNARKAAELRSGWGRPYLLIGDMYASTSSSCGKDGYSRGLAVLAAIDKYAYAKSIDSDEAVAQDANRKISLYNGSIPLKSDVFMRGKQNATVKVGCWIGETVKVRYREE